MQYIYIFYLAYLQKISFSFQREGSELKKLKKLSGELQTTASASGVYSSLMSSTILEATLNENLRLAEASFEKLQNTLEVTFLFTLRNLLACSRRW